MMDPAATSHGIDPLRTAGTITRLARLLDRRPRRRQGADGLGLADLGVLAEIDRGALLPSAIARATFLDPARVTRVVDRLVSLRLVTRTTSLQDRRPAPLAPTEGGYARLVWGRSDARAIMTGMLEPLATDERDELAHALGALRRVLPRPAQREPD